MEPSWPSPGSRRPTGASITAGAYQSDVTIMDLASKTFKDVAKFEGMDSWPLWSRDGFIYFVSDREGKGQTNIWRVPGDGSQPEQITHFTTGDVRFPGISGDGKTIVFEHDFGIWKLDNPSRKVKPHTTSRSSRKPSRP